MKKKREREREGEISFLGGARGRGGVTGGNANICILCIKKQERGIYRGLIASGAGDVAHHCFIEPSRHPISSLPPYCGEQNLLFHGPKIYDFFVKKRNILHARIQ